MALTLSSLHIYPVKGLKGIDLPSARCTDRGLERDRRWMVVDAEGEFLSQREVPKMATVWTDLTDEALTLSAPDMPEVDVPLEPRPTAPIRVRVWRSVCDAIPVSSYADSWLSEYLGLSCRLVYMPESTRRLSNPDYAKNGEIVSFADGYAYLVTTEASLADLNERMIARGARAIPMNRFRPNLVISGATPFAEDDWSEIRIHPVATRRVPSWWKPALPLLAVTALLCLGVANIATLATFRDSEEFGVRFGMNFVTVKTGEIRVGQPVSAGS